MYKISLSRTPLIYAHPRGRLNLFPPPRVKLEEMRYFIFHFRVPSPDKLPEWIPPSWLNPRWRLKIALYML